MLTECTYYSILYIILGQSVSLANSYGRLRGLRHIVGYVNALCSVALAATAPAAEYGSARRAASCAYRVPAVRLARKMCPAVSPCDPLLSSDSPHPLMNALALLVATAVAAADAALTNVELKNATAEWIDACASSLTSEAGEVTCPPCLLYTSPSPRD